MTVYIGVLVVHMIRIRGTEYRELGGRKYENLGLHRFWLYLFYEVHCHLFMCSEQFARPGPLTRHLI